MRLMLWVGEEGPTDNDLKDGDIFSVHQNDWTPGAEELKRFLCVQTGNYGGDTTELVEPEYGPGATPDEPDVRKARKYAVRYWEKLSPSEVIAVRDRNLSVPLMTDRFALTDIVRK